MSLHDNLELETTRKKLLLLEETYRTAEQDSSGSARVRELELHSLQHLMNQLREEIAQFESHHLAASH